MSDITLSSSFSQNILSDFETYTLIQDRLAGDHLTLPYNENSIKIEVNDFVIDETVNYSLEKLYINNLYVLSKSVIPSNNIPETRYYKFIANDTGEGVQWRAHTDFPSVSGSCTAKSLNGIKKLKKVQNINNPNNFNIIATTTTNIILLSGTDTTNIDIIVNPDRPDIVSDSSITHPSNDTRFQNIVDISVSDSNDLFVLDGYHNNIFKFDISGILTLDDAVLKNDTPGRLLTQTVGGHGQLSDKTKFKIPTSMATANDFIYIMDYDPATGVTSIKEFDSQLNWLRTASLGAELSNGPIDIEYNSGNGKLYVISHATSFKDKFGVDAFDTTNIIPVFGEIDIQTLTLTFKSDFYESGRHGDEIGQETYRGIRFSLENSNIFYTITNKNIYKKYISRPTRFVGRFLLTEKKIGTGDTEEAPLSFTDLCIFQTKLTQTNVKEQKSVTLIKDEILLFESNYETLHRFLESSNYEKSIQTELETNYIEFDKIKINPDELVSTFVYNKALIKSLYNSVLILENISRRFTTVFDNNGISNYIGFNYLVESELKKLTYIQSMENSIGVNEIVTTSTVNRCIQKVVELQQTILELIQEKSINVYPLESQPVVAV